MSTLFCPPDRLEANEAWGANCGPCALAAVLRCPVQDVRPFFAGFETRGYVNQTQMQAAIAAAEMLCGPCKGWPRYGVVLIQWLGSWMKAPPRVHSRYTHWVASYRRPGASCRVYDVNAGEWLDFDEWRCGVAAALMRERKANDWIVKRGFEVIEPEERH